ARDAAAGEADAEDGVQLDEVRRRAALSVREVEEARAGDGDGNVGRLEAAGRRVLRAERRARRADRRRPGAARNAARRGDLRDQRVPGAVAHVEVEVAVALQLVLDERDVGESED